MSKLLCQFCTERVERGEKPQKNCGNCYLDRRDAKDKRPQAERWLGGMVEVMNKKK